MKLSLSIITIIARVSWLCAFEINRDWEVDLEKFVANEQFKPVLWVDARSRAAYDFNGVKGALLLNNDSQEDFTQLLSTVLSAIEKKKINTLAVYCCCGNCGISHRIVDYLKKIDLDQSIYVIHGGMAHISQTMPELLKNYQPKK